VHAAGEAATMIVASSANVHGDHHHREVNRGPSGGWGWSLNAFLFSVPLDVIAAWVVQRTRFHVKASFCGSNGFPDTGAVFAQPHGEALHFWTREQAEVSHFPPAG
jgi:hypothetical protein